MDIQAHTTPETRRLLRDYLRSRRLTTSVHNTLMSQTLLDLEEALRLLKGIHHPSAAWTEEIEGFLEKRAPPPAPDPAWALPGLFSTESGGPAA